MVVAPYEAVGAMIACSVNYAILFNGETQTERIATEIFDDDPSVMDKTYVELQEDLKAYSSLTVANGQIRLTHGVTQNIEYISSRHEMRSG